jgi:hypothetical protein
MLAGQLDPEQRHEIAAIIKAMAEADSVDSDPVLPSETSKKRKSASEDDTSNNLLPRQTTAGPSNSNGSEDSDEIKAKEAEKSQRKKAKLDNTASVRKAFGWNTFDSPRGIKDPDSVTQDLIKWHQEQDFAQGKLDPSPFLIPKQEKKKRGRPPKSKNESNHTEALLSLFKSSTKEIREGGNDAEQQSSLPESNTAAGMPEARKKKENTSQSRNFLDIDDESRLITSRLQADRRLALQEHQPERPRKRRRRSPHPDDILLFPSAPNHPDNISRQANRPLLQPSSIPGSRLPASYDHLVQHPTVWQLHQDMLGPTAERFGFIPDEFEQYMSRAIHVYDSSRSTFYNDNREPTPEWTESQAEVMREWDTEGRHGSLEETSLFDDEMYASGRSDMMEWMTAGEFPELNIPQEFQRSHESKVIDLTGSSDWLDFDQVPALPEQHPSTHLS